MDHRKSLIAYTRRSKINNLRSTIDLPLLNIDPRLLTGIYDWYLRLSTTNDDGSWVDRGHELIPKRTLIIHGLHKITKVEHGAK